MVLFGRCRQLEVYFICLFLVFGVEPEASCTPGKRSTTEMRPSHRQLEKTSQPGVLKRIMAINPISNFNCCLLHQSPVASCGQWLSILRDHERDAETAPAPVGAAVTSGQGRKREAALEDFQFSLAASPQGCVVTCHIRRGQSLRNTSPDLIIDGTYFCNPEATISAQQQRGIDMAEPMAPRGTELNSMSLNDTQRKTFS